MSDDVLVLNAGDAQNYRALLYLAQDTLDPTRIGKKRGLFFSERYRNKKIKLLHKQDYFCSDCDREMWMEVQGENFKGAEATFEHVIPYRYGSSMSDNGLLIICSNCNRKRNKHFSLKIVEDHFGPIDWDALKAIPIVEIV